MFHLLHNLAKRLVLQEHTRLTQVRTPVMMLILDTMLIKQANPLKLLALQEPIKHQQVNRLVMMPMQDTMFHLLHNQAKLLVLLEAINQIRGKPPATTPM